MSDEETSSVTPPDAPQAPSIEKEVESFIDTVDSLATSFPLVVDVTDKALKEAVDALTAFVEPWAAKKLGDKSFKAPPEHLSTLLDLIKSVKTSLAVRPVLSSSFLVSLVSQFDAFLGRLIRCLFYLQPGLLSTSERTLTFPQLIELGSVDAAREYLLEKEIESVLRLSHADQFSWLEKKFALVLRKDLAVWPAFIELTERRNLFVHCNGVISSQYFKVCKEHGVTLDDDAKVGKSLGVSAEYFQAACRSLVEIAVKVAHVLWRKVSPKDLGKSDECLISVTYDMLSKEQYELCGVLLDFAVSVLKKHSDEATRRIFLVNRAIVYKWTGKADECAQLLAKEDWSASAGKFRLAIAVLSDDFEAATKIMRQMGPSGEVAEESYRIWPLFKEFRKSEQFAAAYSDVFGHPFVPSMVDAVTEATAAVKEATGAATENSGET